MKLFLVRIERQDQGRKWIESAGVFAIDAIRAASSINSERWRYQGQAIVIGVREAPPAAPLPDADDPGERPG